jgi:hypothetical protein
MSPSAVRRRIVVLVVGALLLALWVPAAEARPAASFREALPTPWTVLARLWAQLAPVRTKNGCTLDPDGTPRCTASQLPGGNGCTLDPSGACAPAQSTTEAGCSLDPNGLCLKGD